MTNHNINQNQIKILNTPLEMREYGFSQTGIFPNKDKVVDAIVVTL